ncbi:MAG: hypothetical protein AVDCRST_MAG26-3831 [uncultured Chloroflexia bacterium]|uniref:Uncharacterized protein n=1 Tax=uncultured Chloroflexia bacterium TaxID=1672391 RepID=A0A6J4JTJ5_9CHLR|nr:MAG: hypothetical protein AVDCRST_MAG26-3831 [uncultured Chloroflexia bacterium]
MQLGVSPMEISTCWKPCVGYLPHPPVLVIYAAIHHLH